jgi:hypothetical protein
MARLISFSTDKFDISKETLNPINPIFGEGVLNWIREKLAGTPYQASKPEPEDWGWYITVKGNDATYMVGASGQPERPASDVDWMIQVHKERSLKDKLIGKNKMTSEDPLVTLLEGFVRGDEAFRSINVEEDA